MKKILLSVIALFAAVSMNAQTAVNDDPSYFNLDKSSGWGGKWFDLKDADGNLTYDASAYEYAWIKFSGNTGKFRFGLTYSEWKSTEAWGETYFDAMNVIEDAEGISFIKLEKEKTYEFGGPDKAASPYAGDTWDKHLRQIWTQDDGTEVSVTIEGIWFGTAAELKAALGGGSSEGGSEGGEEGGSESGEVTYAVFNVDNALGLDKENGTSLTAGTELFNEEEGVLTIGADDTYKPQEVAFAVNDKEAVKGGLQGATNPKDADGTICSETLKEPAAGAFFTFEAKKDGFLYVIHKASANKAYTVFEEGTAIGYKFAAVGDAATDLGAIYQFELKGEGEVNEVKEKVLFAEQLFLQGTDKYDSHLDADGKWVVIKNAEDKAISGLGVIVFPVFADCKYKFNANGSKMTLAGIAFSDADDLTIKTEDGVEIYKGGGATAIQGAKVVTVAGNSAIYNLAGQKVNASYKGIVIKDGKKYIQK